MGNREGMGRTKCPFYRTHNNEYKRITCDGACRGSVIQYTFRTTEAAKRYKAGVCDDLNNWMRCPYAMIAASAYEKQTQRRTDNGADADAGG